MPDISEFGFPWTEAALVEEQKHPQYSSNSQKGTSQ